MKEIVNILYNENYNGIRNIINESTDKDIINLFDAINGNTPFNSEMVYLFLYLINRDKPGNCDIIYRNLGKNTTYNKENLLYLFEECNKLYESHIPIVGIAREQIEDYENIYGWNLEDKFLFPCNSSIYVLIAISKLMNSRKHIQKFENGYDRYKHIIENQIYVVNDNAISNFYLACIIDINNELHKNIFTGDIFSQKYVTYRKDEIYKASFGEPTVHVGKQKRSYDYVYHKYIDKCISICQVTCMLTPARWFQTDSGDLKYLIKFRNKIKDSKIIRLINYYNIRMDIENTGGLAYLIIDVDYYGACLFKRDGLEVDLSVSDIILKSAYHYQLLNKLTSGKCMDTLFLTSAWSGILTNDKRLLDRQEPGTLKVHVSKRYGKIKWISAIFKKPVCFFDWKVFLPETISTGKGFNDIFVLAGPCELCNQTFCGFKVDSEKQGNSLISYLKTEFANKIVLMRKIKNHINEHCLRYLPYIPLDREWNDEKIIEHLKLNSQEKQIIYGY